MSAESSFTAAQLRIAINLRQFFKGKIGGMENYVRNVISGLAQHDLTIWVHRDEVENVRDFAPKARIHGITHEQGESAISQGLKTGRFDVLFCPLLVLEPLSADIPCAVMMPDIQHEFFPEFFDAPVLEWRQRTYAPSARNADVLFTLSEHAKATIVERFGVSPDKIAVVHLDADPHFKKPRPALPSAKFLHLQLPDKYFYFPANFWPHKNHLNVLQALRIAIDSGLDDVHLLLSGSAAGSDKVMSEAKRLGLASRVRFAGYLDRDVVPEVYQHALALLFATKFEGFGIPLLEAFYSETPAITSNAGSCVEVAGDAAILVDPLSPESIATGMLRAAADPALRTTLIERGKERVKAFCWDEAIGITAKAFQRITAPGYVRPKRFTVEEWPRIALVTPSYNMAHFLGETIESVLSQDYPHLDYVVMDAGSKDGTVELLRSYEKRLRWCSEKDKGQADAINKGWHATSGDIFGYLNADDTYLPGALGKIAAHFKRFPTSGMIYGEAYHVDVKGAVLDRYPTRDFDLDLLNEQCFVCQPAAFLLREAYAEAGMMDTGMHFALDYDLWIRVAKKYPVRKVDDYLATSRMHTDNKTLSSRRRVYQEIIDAAKRHFGYVPYEWINGYACYLLDKKDQYFDRSKPGLGSYALSLLLGMRHNPRNLQRYWAEWRRRTGFGGQFTGRWDDGWISSRYELEREIGADCDTVRVSGKHHAPVKGLQLKVQIEGTSIDAPGPLAGGPFLLELPLPEDLRGRKCRLVIESNRTWRPMANGDYRRLSCVIDSVEFSASRKRA